MDVFSRTTENPVRLVMLKKSSALGRFCKTVSNSAIIIRAVDLFSISTFDGQLIFKYCDRYGLNTWFAHSGNSFSAPFVGLDPLRTYA